ncbi:hypothetical protein [Halolamina salina]|uniref:Secreted protein n=1 Tax=Halolamina salina TaxID=1220023 RepID=A0ABD6B5T4_9EURY
MIRPPGSLATTRYSLVALTTAMLSPSIRAVGGVFRISTVFSSVDVAPSSSTTIAVTVAVVPGVPPTVSVRVPLRRAA